MTEYVSYLEKILKEKIFAVTCEISPPKNADGEIIKKKARILKDYVDAVNLTDCQVATVRFSSFAGSLLVLSEGLEPIMQMTCRDRNRISIQSELLGAWALGIRNLFCTTGDHPKFGDHPSAKPVFDLDSIQFIQLAKNLKEGKFLNGEEIKGENPKFFIGATENPFADPFEFRIKRLAKKIKAGAQFIQTQIVYDIKRFKKFMKIAEEEGLTEKAFILAGVAPPKSYKMAYYMKYNIPGFLVPDEILERMKSAKDPQEEGIKIAEEIIEQIREISGVRGIHIMAIGWEEIIPEIIKNTGLYPRPPKLEVEKRIFPYEEINLEELKKGITLLYEGLSKIENFLNKKDYKIKEKIISSQKDEVFLEIVKKEPEKIYFEKKETEEILSFKGIYRDLKQRAEGIPEELYIESPKGKIKEIKIGIEPNYLKIGGSEILPFHFFEGNSGYPVKIAMEVLDVKPEDFPEPLLKYFGDVYHDPAAWAKKCVETYKAEAIALYLIGTDPNYLDLDVNHAVEVVKKVKEAVEVPLIIWGCDNAEKDAQILKEVAEIVKDRGVLIGPVVDENYKTLGAVALGYNISVIASSPIDVNIAKQLNILLENLGVPLEKIIMDPSVGALGYGLEYTYSVMERIRLAALYGEDLKLQVPFICNVGREVWKIKEVNLPSDEYMGEREMRGIIMEAITTLVLSLAGGELFIMRHPKAVELVKIMFKALGEE